MSRILLLPALACLLVLSFACDSGAEPWRPGPGATEIALWPEGLAIARPAVEGEETATTGPELIGGRTVTAIANVTRPAMAVYPARGRNSGAAIFVYPGGGYQILAIDLEGTDVCDWLTPRGITCIVLKYRVPWGGPHWDRACHCQVVPPVPMALQDAQRAMVLFRRRAASFGVDPHRIGVLGFSAGGHLVAAMSNATARAYPRVDAADDESSRPDFAIALYPGHLWNGHDLDLYDYMRVSAATPPTFLIQAEDDPVAEWPALVERWLRTIGMVRPT